MLSHHGPNGALALRLVVLDPKHDQEKLELQECMEVSPALLPLKADHAMLIHAPLTVLFPVGQNGAFAIEHVTEESPSEPELLSPHHSEEGHAPFYLKNLHAIPNHAQLTVLLAPGTHGPLAL